MKEAFNFFMIFTFCPAISSCNEDGKIVIPTVQRTPTPQPSPQEILASKGMARITLTNNTSKNVEYVVCKFKHARNLENGNTATSWEFLNVLLEPGQWVNLEVRADLYREVNCLQGGRRKKSMDKLHFLRGK